LDYILEFEYIWKIKMADKIVLSSVTVAGGQEVNFLHFSGNFHKESVMYFL